MLAKFSANAYFKKNEHHCKPSPFHTSSVLEAEHPDIDCVFALIFFFITEIYGSSESTNIVRHLFMIISKVCTLLGVEWTLAPFILITKLSLILFI